MTCEVCDKQPRGRRSDPLPCMESDPNKEPFSSRVRGRGTDDAYYICRECGHEWMHESGKDGCGWLP